MCSWICGGVLHKELPYHYGTVVTLIVEWLVGDGITKNVIGIILYSKVTGVE